MLHFQTQRCTYGGEVKTSHKIIILHKLYPSGQA